jgi:hypothetical protein
MAKKNYRKSRGAGKSMFSRKTNKVVPVSRHPQPSGPPPKAYIEAAKAIRNKTQKKRSK